MKIFAFSGLGADARVFHYLQLDYELVVIDWIRPFSKESIEEYALRLVEENEIGNGEIFGVLGVSFGGLIAVEVSKITQPQFTILISSVETRSELNWGLKFIGKTKLINLMPTQFFNPPRAIAYYLFGTKNKDLLNAILNDTDTKFAKWAVRELLNWRNEDSISNLIKIGGSSDKLLPPKGMVDKMIDQGKHFMIVDRATEITQFLNLKLKNY